MKQQVVYKWRNGRPKWLKSIGVYQEDTNAFDVSMFLEGLNDKDTSIVIFHVLQALEDAQTHFKERGK